MNQYAEVEEKLNKSSSKHIKHINNNLTQSSNVIYKTSGSLKRKALYENRRKSISSRRELNNVSLTKSSRKKSKLINKKLKVKGHHNKVIPVNDCLDPNIYSTTPAKPLSTLKSSTLLIPKNHRKCDNIVCSVVSSKQTTSLNKWLKFKISNGEVIWLCTLCSDAFLKNQYCYYCYSIYSEEIHDGKQWIECDYCKLWVFNYEVIY